MDAVAGQKVAYASVLYWYTNLERAKKIAEKSGKPILSLRLLGNLDEELSCANSRFFRTVLYANKDVFDFLRQKFVLHWKSVRPVPKVTVDFGDGRQIQCTITANSIHYLLDAKGRVIDALPGLYGAGAFNNALERAEKVIQFATTLSEKSRRDMLADYHNKRLEEIGSTWQQDLDKMAARPRAQRFKGSKVVAAQTRTVGEFASEITMMRALLPDFTKLEATTDNNLWKRIAVLHADGADLDSNSIRLIRSKHPAARDAMPVAMTKALIEDPMLKVIESFQRSISEDTVRNEYQLRRQIHQWLAQELRDGEARDVESLNHRVYAELFLTPLDDPWMGLSRSEVYTALPGRGIVWN